MTALDSNTGGYQPPEPKFFTTISNSRWKDRPRNLESWVNSDWSTDSVGDIEGVNSNQLEFSFHFSLLLK